MSARCQNGSRVSCDVEGLPTASELGVGALPAAQALVNSRQVAPALAGPLQDAGARFSSCFGLAPDEGIAFLYVPAFGLGAAGCNANDVDAGLSYYQCMATADCGEISNQSACSSELANVQTALACSDLGVAQGGGGANVEDMDPPLRDGVDAYCGALLDCGLTDFSIGECEQAMAD